MQWLAEICVRRPVLATVIILLFVVVGLAGYTKLSVDRFPKVDAPTITVTTTLDGASPKEMETEVTDRIEEAVNTISGIDDLSSTSSEGVSIVRISFVLEKDSDIAAQEVRDRINRIFGELPKDVDQPKVEKMDPDSAPILSLSLVSDRPVREITEYADKVLRRQLENVAGVGQVTLLGGRKRQINVWLDPVRLQSHGLTAIDAQQTFNRQNVQISGGAVKNAVTDRNLRVIGKAQSVEEIGQLIVKTQDGGLVRVKDVARVEDGEAEADSVARKNGVNTVVLSIRRQSGENIIDVVDSVKSRLAEIRRHMPEGYRVEVVRDNSLVIKTSTGIVKEHLILGALLAALVVMLFLGNSRATIISAISIPCSIVSTFGIMWIAGQTINEISLVALALVVGIVIDDTIIVVENIFKHVEEHGEESFSAAVSGTKEIGPAVMATTLSLLAVFLPVAFMGGMVGKFLKSFGLTMSFAIAISLLISFTLAPALAARLFKNAGASWLDRRLEGLVNLFYRPVERFYIWLLGHALSHRWAVVLVAVAAVAACQPMLKMIGKDFMPSNEEAQFAVSIRAPEGTSLAATDLIAERVAREIRLMSDVEYTLLTIGDDSQGATNLASIYVRLVDPSKRKPTQSQIMEKVRDELLPKLPKELRVSVMEVSPFGGSGGGPNGVSYVIAGPSLDRLSEVSAKVLAEMRKLSGVRDADSSHIPGKPEITVLVDRSKAGQMGISVSDLSTTLRLLVGGLQVSTYEDKGEQYDIRLRADEQFRNDKHVLSMLSVPSAGQLPVSLLNVVSLGAQEGPAQINRLNRRRQVTLSANIASGSGVSQQDILDGIDQIVKMQNLSSDYFAGPTSMSKELGKTMNRFVTAFTLALVFMYLILAAQFESWLHPFTILLSLPLTLPFALLGLLLLGQSLNIFSALGLLVLFGVVKKNGILQIDHTNQLRAMGMPRREALLRANRDRLRPILMTTAAFVAGMIPMMLAKGIGSAFHNATAGIVVGGQTLSLLLTLVAIPVFYSLFDDVIIWIKCHLTNAHDPLNGRTCPQGPCACQSRRMSPRSAQSFSETLGA